MTPPDTRAETIVQRAVEDAARRIIRVMTGYPKPTYRDVLDSKWRTR